MWTAYAGLVCAGGTYVTGWDPRQEGNADSATPAFSVKHTGVTGDFKVYTMISAGSPDCDGPPQLLTGVFTGSLLL